jgi:biotin transport system substrate-specific component
VVSETRRSVLTAAFAALIAAGAFVSIPLPFSPVPLTLQTLFVLLVGLALPPRWAAIPPLIYLGVGAVGLPVFSGGTAGIGPLLGPTGGYLFGFVPATVVTSLVSQAGAGTSARRDVLAATLGTAMVYGFGVGRLALTPAVSMTDAILTGLLPFLPGDGLKIAVAVVSIRPVRAYLPISVSSSVSGSV